jgi:hypothetical protein
MKARIVLASMVLGVLAMVFATQAQETPPSATDIAKVKDDLRLKEQILARQFAEFESALLKLKDRLKRSGKKEDKLRAEILEKVLEHSKDASIAVQFEQMVDMLKNSKLNSIGDLKILDDKSHKLADDLREILNKMREDPKHARLRDERLSLEKLIKEIERIIQDEKRVQGQTDRGKTDPTELKNIQQKVTKDTGKVAKEMAKKSDQGGEAKNSKGDAKDGGKEGKKGESKDAGKGAESKKGETKEAGGDPKANKGDAKGKEGKQGEAKAGQKGADGKEGAKGSKGSEGAKAEPKDNKGGSKEGEKGVKEAKIKEAGKDGEKKADAKGGEKSGEPKSGAKSSQPKEAGGAKGSKSEAKPGDSKSGGKKSDADSKQGEAKSGQKSDGQGQAKNSPQQSDPPKADQKSDQAQKPQPQQPQDNVANGKKQVEDAEYKMKKAEDNIAKKDNKEASKDQGDAITDLEKAKKKLEDLLRQIREEELERLLAALQARCEKMLAMQIQVLAGTEGVFKVVDALADKKPTRQNQQDSLKLSDNEKDIVAEATKAIEMLEAEGSAVAFPEVFQQVRQDMMNVQRRLEITDVGVVTQAIEKDIIDTLKEMIEALKKARQELDNKKSPPSAGQPPPNADQKLLDQIAELKMIRSMQLRVNNRTQTYGKMYVPKEGEQTSDPTIRRELTNLSERQERIFDITNRIAKGDNK